MTISWKNYNWIAYTHTKWDSSNYDNAYFGEEGVAIENNAIVLSIVKNPKDFTNDKENKTYTKQYCCGEVASEKSFSYGTFIWKAKVPQGSYLWDAIWLCGRDSWPPEIDCLESYTAKSSDHKSFVNSFKNNPLFTNLETNVHYRDKDGVHKQIKGKGIPTLIYKLFKKDIDEWKIVWKPDSIKMYWNGVLIRCVCDFTENDRNILKHFNENNKMYAIMNRMVDHKFDDKAYKENTKMYIYDFQYIPFTEKRI